MKKQAEFVLLRKVKLSRYLDEESKRERIYGSNLFLTSALDGG
jgi:hypothetical protein